MSDMMTILLAGVEEIAKNMKEQAKSNPATLTRDRNLEQKVEELAIKVDRLLYLLNGKLGDWLATAKPQKKRMMDIKQRIGNIIRQHPEGIKPPQIAKIIGTRVQNLYPHLKHALQHKQIVKDKSGMYFPAGK